MGFPKIKELISFLPLNSLAMRNERNINLNSFCKEKKKDSGTQQRDGDANYRPSRERNHVQSVSIIQV